MRSILKEIAPDIDELMNSSLTESTKMKLLKSRLNNISRTLTSHLVKTYNVETHKSRKGNSFKGSDGFYGFTITSGDDAECRQYYEDFNGFFCYNISRNKLYYCEKGSETTKSGTGNENITATSIKVPLSDCAEVTLEDFVQYFK